MSHGRVSGRPHDMDLLKSILENGTDNSDEGEDRSVLHYQPHNSRRKSPCTRSARRPRSRSPRSGPKSPQGGMSPRSGHSPRRPHSRSPRRGPRSPRGGKSPRSEPSPRRPDSNHEPLTLPSQRPLSDTAAGGVIQVDYSMRSAYVNDDECTRYPRNDEKDSETWSEDDVILAQKPPKPRKKPEPNNGKTKTHSDLLEIKYQELRALLTNQFSEHREQLDKHLVKQTKQLLKQYKPIENGLPKVHQASGLEESGKKKRSPQSAKAGNVSDDSTLVSDDQAWTKRRVSSARMYETSKYNYK